MSSDTRPWLLSFLGVLLLCEVIILISDPLPLKEELKQQHQKGSNFLSFDRPLIVLYQGSSKGHDFVYSTAFWTGWGTNHQNILESPVTKTLPWAAEGVKVTKSCDVSCYVSDSQGLIPLADAVVMEVINHPRSFGNTPINWPSKKVNQLWGLFFFEPYKNHQDFLTDDVLNRFDFKVISKQDSDIPITLICPWGRSKEAYLASPPKKTAQAPICDFSMVVPTEYFTFFKGFRNHLSVHSFAGPWKNKDAPEPFSLPNRLKDVGKYKFVIIVETVIEDDWVGPEISQAWLSGTVPIYLGAPNIDDFVPGENSLIKVTDFSTGEELAEYIDYLLENEEEYKKFFNWKKNGLAPSFERHLENCAHYAECRICHHVLDYQNKG